MKKWFILVFCLLVNYHLLANSGVSNDDKAVKHGTTTLSLNNQTVCANSIFTLSPVTNATNATWYWVHNSSSQITVTATVSKTTSFTVIMTCVEGTFSTTCVVFVNSGKVDEAQFNYGSFCNSDSSILPVHQSDYVINGFYKATAGLLIDTAIGKINALNSALGVFTVHLYSLRPNEGCPGKPISSATIEIIPVPEVGIIVPPVIIPGDTLSFVSTGAKLYTWSGFDLSCYTCSNPSLLKPTNSKFCVIGSNGECRDTACVVIDNTCENNFLFNLPTAFSPNNDGINDLYCLKGWDYCVIDFKIVFYNRLGEAVFESIDPSFCWDGKYKNQPLETEVVFYSLSFRDKEKGGVHYKKGNITFLK